MHITVGAYRKLLDQIVVGAPESVRLRFWAKVTKTDECWTTMSGDADNYGKFSFMGRTHPAHRVSLLWSMGVPKYQDMMACHLCRNRNCVRPLHLYFGTATENMNDRVRDNTDTSGSRHPMARIDEGVVKRIIKMSQVQGLSSTSIAKEVGTTRGTVKNILSGATWKNVEGQRIKRGLKGIKKSYGTRGHPQSALVESDVFEIRRKLFNGIQAKELAKAYGVTNSQINHIKTRRAWAHLPDEQNGALGARPQRKRLDLNDVAEIKKILLAENNRYGICIKLARQYNASPTIITGIKQGRTYAAVKPAT